MSASVSTKHALEANLHFYRRHADRFCHRTADVDLTSHYQRFKDFASLRKGSHILDAGCGSGRDSLAFQRMGYRVTAIDASPEMVARARRNGVKDVRLQTFQEIDEVDTYDAIWAFASLLHVPQSEFADVIRRLAASLRCDGVIYITVKEGEPVEQFVEDGRFFCYYTAEHFQKSLGAETRLHKVDFWKSDDLLARQSLQWLNIVLKHRCTSRQEQAAPPDSPAPRSRRTKKQSAGVPIAL